MKKSIFSLAILSLFSGVYATDDQELCSIGDAISCYVVAEQYHEGKGAKKDLNKALVLHRQNCDEREFLLSCISSKDIFKNKGDAVGEKKYEAKAKAMAKRQCEEGSEDSCEWENLFKTFWHE